MFPAFHAGAVYGAASYGARGQANYTATVNELLAASDNMGIRALFSAGVADAVSASDFIPALLHGNQTIVAAITCADELRFRLHPFHPRKILEWEEEERDGIITQEERAGQTGAYHTPPARADGRKLALDKESRNTKLQRSDRVF